MIIKSYTISTNKGTDVVDKIGIPKYNETNPLHYKLSLLSKKAHEYFKTKDMEELENCIKQINLVIPEIFEENMKLKESVLAAIKQKKGWADAKEICDFMVKNDYFVGGSKIPENSIAAILHRYADEKIIDEKIEKENKISFYRIKQFVKGQADI